MSVIREVLRLVGQLLWSSLRQRRFGLLLVVVVGAALLALALTTSAAAPVLIYPVL